jgi:lysozyme family protein
MKANWDMSWPLLLVTEGPEVNIGGTEPGGASHFGVSVSALTDLRKKQGLPPATVDVVRNLTAQDAAAFYRAVTAEVCRFDDLAVGVDYRMLDIFANLGPTGGARLVCVTLGIWPTADTVTDTVMGEIGKHDPEVLVVALGAAWLSKKHESPGWAKSGHGWTNRANRVNGDAIRMIEGEKK